MDYVVFGTGFGASVLVLGLLVREVGPRLRYRAPADGGDVLHAEELVARIAWTRFIAALGSVLAIAGAVFLIVTFACIFLMLSDRTGGWVMLGTLAVILLLLLYWTWAFFDRFGSYGILPERAAVEEPVAPPPTRTPAAATTHGNTGERPGPAASQGANGAPAAGETAVYGPAVPAGVSTAASVSSAGDDRGNTAPLGEEARRETPEEILAHSEAPLDHGSVEDELDIAGAQGTRPSKRSRARRAGSQPETPAASEPESPPADETTADAGTEDTQGAEKRDTTDT